MGQVLQDLSREAAAQKIVELEAQLAAMKAASQRKLTLKVTAKKPDGTGTDGAVSLYGLGRFPITLYAGQWERLLGEAEHIAAFIKANGDLISRKD